MYGGVNLISIAPGHLSMSLAYRWQLKLPHPATVTTTRTLDFGIGELHEDVNLLYHTSGLLPARVFFCIIPIGLCYQTVEN
jgi:hypothetical protein